MQKLAVLGVTGSLVASAFLAGVAVGKATPPVPKFTAVDELKWEDIGGVKLAVLYGDVKKGPYGALLKIPAGMTSPIYSRSGSYEAVQIAGVSSHWMRGEDGTKAKKMTPGSYWTIPAKTEHVSTCARGPECIVFTWQKTKFDAALAKDQPIPTTAGVTNGSGTKAAAAVPQASTATAPAAAPSTALKAGAGSGSATPKAPTAGSKTGSAAPSK